MNGSGNWPVVTVDLWNVGQGDASSLRLPSGELILIDVGPKGSPLSQWLRAAPRGTVRDIILTHNDADHAGALPEILMDPTVVVRRVLMLEDRDRASPRQRALFLPVCRWAERGGGVVGRLECPPSGSQVLWSDAGIGAELCLRHPTFTGNVVSRSPNDASAILTLEVDTNPLVVWTGDAPLGRISRFVGASVCLLFGPHHGAPRGDRRNVIRQALASLAPTSSFISVGTGNSYSHPSPKYIADLAKRGCRVACTQMTDHCDRERVHKGRHVMNTSGYLGLPAPANGVFCRGHVRLTVSASGVVFDRYQGEHRKRLAEDAVQGRRLLCLPPSEVV